MHGENHLDLDVRAPDWAEHAADLVARVAKAPPQGLTVQAQDAPAQSGHAAQTLLYLRRRVEAAGGRFAVEGPSPAFVEGLRRLGLQETILGAEGTRT